MITTQTDDPGVQPSIQPFRESQVLKSRSVRYFSRKQRRIGRCDLRDGDGRVKRGDGDVSAVDHGETGLIRVETCHAGVAPDLGLTSGT